MRSSSSWTTERSMRNVGVFWIQRMHLPGTYKLHFIRLFWCMAVLFVTWDAQFSVCFGPISRKPSFVSPFSMRQTSSRYHPESSYTAKMILYDSSSSSSELLVMNMTTFNGKVQPNQLKKSPTKMPTLSTDSIQVVTSSSNQKENKNTTSSSSNNNKKYFVSPEQLEQLQNSIDIILLIESYNIPKFQRLSGDRAVCLCPFHNDHNPSLKIDRQRNIFKCFACGIGGNALTFVKEYAKQQCGVELSFLQTVKILDDIVVQSSGKKMQSVLPMDIEVPKGVRPTDAVNNILRQPGLAIGTTNKKRISSSTKQTQASSTASSERILLANLHAATFYEECLSTRLEAGVARQHLRSRGFNPYTVKTFVIGFAPESYFRTDRENSNAWGEGSLVNYLKDRGFTPQEILDAGLAIRTKHGKRQLEQEEQEHNNSNNNTSIAAENDYSTLMDRFRGRLIVPIFDADGNFALGFGGRILESVASGSDYKAAKYLNSPESVVFSKKNILFGQHMAEKSITLLRHKKRQQSSSTTEKHSTVQSLIIVEGYMDAIALWQAGVQETVASMGTALTLEQLSAAANTARKLGGRITLCLDNDDAGIAALERLCKGQRPILYEATEENRIEIYVAELPPGVKDPDEYLQQNKEIEKLDDMFRKEVVDSAVDWSEWYTDRIISASDTINETDENGRFSQLFDQLAAFLSVFDNVDDRGKKAFMMALKLAPFVATNGDKTTICRQLESDLNEKAANIAHRKSMSFHRSLEISESSMLFDDEQGKTMGVAKSLEISQDIALSEALGRNEKKNAEASSSQIPEANLSDDDVHRTGRRTKRKRVRIKIPSKRTSERSYKSMTKHVGNVEAHKLDDLWLGAASSDSAEQKHLWYDISTFGSKSNFSKQSFGPDSCVRFNHNLYHGTWTTSSAAAAGYLSNVVPKSLDFLTKGTSSLIEMKQEEMFLSVEDLLLRLLVKFPEARKSLSETIQVSEASGSGRDIYWSTPAKAWLFKCLVDEIEKLSSGTGEIQGIMELRSYLATRPDIPSGSLSAITDQEEEIFLARTQSSVGSTSGSDSISSSDTTIRMTSSEKYISVDLEPVEIVNSEDIPIVLEEWSDFAEMEGYTSEVFSERDTLGPRFTVSDHSGSFPQPEDSSTGMEVSNQDGSVDNLVEQRDDPVIVPEKMYEDRAENKAVDYLEADFEVSDESTSEGTSTCVGTLDHFFVDNEDDTNLFITMNGVTGESIPGGDNAEKKACAAVQDLYTMTQFISLSLRVKAGRLYLAGRGNQSLLESANGETNEEIVDSLVKEPTMTLNVTSEELAKYCSSSTSSNGLRHDLQRIGSLAKANQRATDRIYSFMQADFTDSTGSTRGYNWLGNVLRFNDMRVREWNDHIEAKEGFFHSDEEVETLEDHVISEWKELSDTEEMWEWYKHVDTNHISHIAETIVEQEYDEGLEGERLEQFEEEWGWALNEQKDDAHKE